MKAPQHIFAHWKDVERKIRHAGSIAFFSDFDGTLARIRRHPDQAKLSPRVRRLVRRIADSSSIAGVVSGRKVADVRRRVGLGHLWYAGSHGFFLRDPSNRSFSLLTLKQRDCIRMMRGVLARDLRRIPGLLLEPKEATIAVHYRNAPSHSRNIARGVIAELLERCPGASLLSGKKVWELLPDSRIDKWAAISFILQRKRILHPGGRWLIIFLGDDATDERVFQRMRGISIAVGKKSNTAARYYLRSPAEVVHFLERLTEAMG